MKIETFLFNARLQIVTTILVIFVMFVVYGCGCECITLPTPPSTDFIDTDIDLINDPDNPTRCDNPNFTDSTKIDVFFSVTGIDSTISPPQPFSIVDTLVRVGTGGLFHLNIPSDGTFKIEARAFVKSSFTNANCESFCCYDYCKHTILQTGLPQWKGFQQEYSAFSNIGADLTLIMTFNGCDCCN
jgi:hypothetical protein